MLGTLKRTRLGFTGTRKGMTLQQGVALGILLQQYQGEFHHGDCVGSDREASDLVAAFPGWHQVIHPPEISFYRAYCVPKNSTICTPKPYLQRDRDIVDNTDRLVATPDSAERPHSGTWYTIQYAQKLLRPIAIIMPDGQTTYERWS